MARQLEEWPCIETEGQILRLRIQPEHGNTHFLILREEEFDLWSRYQKVGSEKVISLSHHFDTVYGVSEIAGMDPKTATLIGSVLLEWGTKNS